MSELSNQVKNWHMQLTGAAHLCLCFSHNAKRSIIYDAAQYLTGSIFKDMGQYFQFQSQRKFLVPFT